MAGRWGGLFALVLCLVALAACNTTQTYVPNAVVILNPTPGQPSLYNAQIYPGGNIPSQPYPPYPPRPCTLPYPSPCPYPPTPPDGYCIASHKVRAGDTVSALAVLYRVSVWGIAIANRLTNPHWIYVGQILCIPQHPPKPGHPSPTRPPNGQCAVQHIVKAGESVSGLATQYNVSIGAIVAANNLANPNFITVGQSLCIPPPGATPVPTTPPVIRTATPTFTPSPTIPPALPTATPPPSGVCTRPAYYVRPKDSWASIAQLCSVSIPALVEANPYIPPPPYALIPGQWLIIPGPY